MNEIKELDTEQEELNGAPKKPSRSPNLLYILIAAVLLIVIVVAAILLITRGIPALSGDKEPTAAAASEPAATAVATFTPMPTKEATHTPVLPAMSDTDTPRFGYVSAGARPAEEWTGFFGNVVDTAGSPVAGVPVIVWDLDGQPASAPVLTDLNGYYEIVLAKAPLAGMWKIQLLTEDGRPASNPFGFETDENTESGIQQLQVLWRELP